MRRFLFIATTCLAIGGAAAFLMLHRHRPAPTLAYVGTAACAACHQDEWRNWQQSDHRHAMEIPDAQSVLGDFKDASFDYFGTKSRFFTRDGKYYVETDNAQGQLQTFQVAYTFGHYPLQQYLVAFPDGRMQALSLSWDSRPAAQGGQHWFHLYPDEHITHDDALHWTGAFQNWNSRCASCHSTDLVKNYSPDTDRYATTWQEINVGCEACHGQGSRHVAWAKGDRSLPDKGLTTSLGKLWAPHDGVLDIPQLADTPLSGQLQVCSGCHSRRSELQQPDVARDFFDNYSLSPLLQGRYFADGQIREEVYETGSFLQSRMHANHVSCSNCHEPHSGKLRFAGNQLCLQCHQPQKYQTEAHFFHKEDSPGAQCVNCHMPQHTYMVVDVRRDHSLRVPDPVASVRYGVPDACTQCHKDKTDQWAADIVTKRTGRKEPYYPHTALRAAAWKNDAAVLPDLLAYARDAGRPAILRAAVLLDSSRFPSAQQLDAVSTALTSPDPLVRATAVAALTGADPQERLRRLQPVLADPSKSVRMAAAQQLADLPLTAAPSELRAALGELFDEYRQSLLYNADMPESLSNLGLFQAAQGDLSAAELSLRRARKLAPRYLPAMLNLADVYRAEDHDDLGETLLHDAVAAYPESADAKHMLGLLYVR
ncbi:MAG TPA: HEAT repeat domain-containing protein, partial [Steroidobacteraceae bacterium]|nr:HEAT repeat domain-containing protein [Steroidobacteraceae bacterium]